MPPDVNGTNQPGTVQQPAGSAQNTTVQQPTQQQPAAQPFLTIKYNGAEEPLDRERAIEFAQKGRNYDHVHNELMQLRNNPGLSYLAQKAQQFGMTVEQLIEADRKREEQEQVNQLIQKNVPQEYAQEMLENRKFRQQYESERQSNQARETQNKMYQEFYDAYPNVTPDTIPQEVWQAVKSGQSLMSAYTRWENKSLQEKIKGFETQQQNQQANTQNAQTSTGSVKSGGQLPSDFISKDEFDKNKGNQKWVMDNYDKLMKSQRKWFK